MGLLGIITNNDIVSEYSIFKELTRNYELKYKYEPSANFLVSNSIYNFFNTFKDEEYFIKRHNKEILISLKNELSKQQERRAYEVDCYGNLMIQSFLRLCRMIPKSDFEVKNATKYLLCLKEDGRRYRELSEFDKHNYCNHLSKNNQSLYQVVEQIKKEHTNSNISKIVKQIEIQQVMAL